MTDDMGRAVVFADNNDEQTNEYAAVAEIFLQDEETGNDTDTVIATIRTASADSVSTVLAQDAGDIDGRSEWVWIRLQDGSLILGVFPRGDTYFSVEEDAAF